MARKEKTGEIPGMTGPGVESLSIPEIDKAVAKYEREKDRRFQASPGEVAAKRDLTAILVRNRDKLHVDEDGHRFYRHEGVDYYIDEVLKRRKVAEDDGIGEE